MEDERDPHDNYETPAGAVHQLLSNVKLEGGVWDPSCGRGAIVKALLDAGVPAYKIAASDKYEHRKTVLPRGTNLTPTYGVDFTHYTGMHETCLNIIMNPPFSQADAHVRHALKLLPSNGRACVLLRLTWMAANKRSDLLKHLVKIIIVGRLKMLPPGVPDRGHNGAVDFAWFIFEPRVVSATEIINARGNANDIVQNTDGEDGQRIPGGDANPPAQDADPVGGQSTGDGEGVGVQGSEADRE